MCQAESSPAAEIKPATRIIIATGHRRTNSNNSNTSTTSANSSNSSNSTNSSCSCQQIRIHTIPSSNGILTTVPRLQHRVTKKVQRCAAPGSVATAAIVAAPAPKHLGTIVAEADSETLIADEHPTRNSLPPCRSLQSKMIVEARNKIDVATLTKLELELLKGSRGLYDPRQLLQLRRVPVESSSVRAEVSRRVSVLTPTMSSRRRYHEALWESFVQQDWPDKELIVLESYEEEPSPFLVQKAKEDSRLVHVAIRIPAGMKDISVGMKRNITLLLASGQFVVNFDDDDLYSARYCRAMIDTMDSEGLVAATLSGWHNYYREKGQCTYSDADSWGEWAETSEELSKILYGYGFSYSHRRRVAVDHPYPDVEFAEDAPFMLKFREVYGHQSVGLLEDTEGLCVHILHKANSAQVLASSVLTQEEIDELAVSSLDNFHLYRSQVGPIGRTYHRVVDAVKDYFDW